MRRLAIFAAAMAALAGTAPAEARPPLSDVAEIDDTLMVIAIADDIRKRCDGIDARLWRALRTIQALEARARDLGYSDDEIEAYVSADAEKARMRAKALAWLDGQGVDGGDAAALCAYGRQAIAQDTPVGRLLR